MVWQVKMAPWTFAIATFCISAFVKSQAATLAITLPLGLALGLPVPLLLGLVPASYASFFFAFYPSDLAAINFDRTGTTRGFSREPCSFFPTAAVSVQSGLRLSGAVNVSLPRMHSGWSA